MGSPFRQTLSLHDACFPIHYLDVGVALVRSRGGDPAALYKAAGLNPQDPSSPSATLSGEQLLAVMDLTLQHCPAGEPPALQILRHFPLTAHGTLGMLTITCETVGDALGAALQYYPLVMPGLDLHREIVSAGIRVRVKRTIDFGQHNDLITEVILGVFHNIAPYAMAKDLSMQVRLRHKPQGDVAAYAAFFGEPVVFEAEEDSFFVPHSTLQCRLLTSNRVTRAALQALLLREVSYESHIKPFMQRVKRILSLSLSSGATPSAEQVAGELAMSSRTLSRRLQDEGVTLNELLEQIRIERAERLLLTTSRPISEVGRKAGFKDPSAFSRAFKRATGLTPAEMRGRGLGAGSESSESL